MDSTSGSQEIKGALNRSESGRPEYGRHWNIRREGRYTINSAVHRIELLLDLPEKKGYCGRARKSLHLRSVINPLKEKAIHPTCKSWACRVCSAWMRAEAGRHYGMKIVDTDGVVFRDRCVPGEWEEKKKLLRKLNASWVRIGCVWQPCLILGCVPSPVGNPLLPELDREEAVKLLGKALREIKYVSNGPDTRFRPIDCSKSWRREPREKEYERVQWLTTRSCDAVVSFLYSRGIGSRVRRGVDGTVWDVMFEIDEDKKSEIEVGLKSLAH